MLVEEEAKGGEGKEGKEGKKRRKGKGREELPQFC